VIENIEEFATELEIHAFREVELAMQRKIHLPRAGSKQNIAAQRTLCLRRGSVWLLRYLCKGSWIEADSARAAGHMKSRGTRRPMQVKRLTRDDIRAELYSEAVYNIISPVQIVWHAGLREPDSVDRPAA
jgi:hypothetical protein